MELPASWTRTSPVPVSRVREPDPGLASDAGQLVYLAARQQSRRPYQLEIIRSRNITAVFAPQFDPMTRTGASSVSGASGLQRGSQVVVPMDTTGTSQRLSQCSDSNEDSASASTGPATRPTERGGLNRLRAILVRQFEARARSSRGIRRWLRWPAAGLNKAFADRVGDGVRTV